MRQRRLWLLLVGLLIAVLVLVAQLCVGTSIAIILPTTIRSYLTHRQKGLVIPRVIRLWAVPAVIGVTCGSAIAAFAPAAVFKIAFVLIAGFIAIKFLFAGDRWNLGTEVIVTFPPERVMSALARASDDYGFSWSVF